MQSWLTKLEGKAGRENDLRGRHSLYSATERQSSGDTLFRYWEAKLKAGGQNYLWGDTHSTQLLGGEVGGQSWEAKL